jgi:hypothetical protein
VFAPQDGGKNDADFLIGYTSSLDPITPLARISLAASIVRPLPTSRDIGLVLPHNVILAISLAVDNVHDRV